MSSVITKTRYKPDVVSPPGETLLETLEMLGLSQAELAERTGRPKKTINEIIQGKAAITPETALQFELVLRVPAAFWLAREAKYRAWLAGQEEDTRIDKEIDWLDQLPIKEMVAYGWIEKKKEKREQVKEVLGFFGVVSSDKIPRVEEVAFRRSEAFATNPWALAAWLRKGELDAQDIQAAPYDREEFVAALSEIRKLTPLEPDAFLPRLRKLCSDAGVKIVVVRELPKTSVSGATRWLGPDKPLIQLSLRNKTNDMFWFAFFHKSGHVVHEHAKREVLLEDKFEKSLDERENVANRFAMDILIPPQELHGLLQQKNETEDGIRSFAKRSGIAPAIVLGRLQHEGRLDWSQFRRLKRPFSWNTWPSTSN